MSQAEKNDLTPNNKNILRFKNTKNYDFGTRRNVILSQMN
jgi:hypothetical protein